MNFGKNSGPDLNIYSYNNHDPVTDSNTFFSIPYYIQKCEWF